MWGYGSGYDSITLFPAIMVDCSGNGKPVWVGVLACGKARYRAAANLSGAEISRQPERETMGRGKYGNTERGGEKEREGERMRIKSGGTTENTH